MIEKARSKRESANRQAELARAQAAREHQETERVLTAFADAQQQLASDTKKYEDFVAYFQKHISEAAEKEAIRNAGKSKVALGFGPQPLTEASAIYFARMHQEQILAGARDFTVGSGERLIATLVKEDGKILKEHGLV